MKCKVPRSWAVLLAAWLFCTPLASGDELYALKASQVLNGEGASFVDGVVVIKGAKVVSVGSKVALPESCRVIDLGDTVLCPGLIDLYTACGAARHDSESADALQLQAGARDLFDPHHHDFERALAAGVTTVMVAPSPENVIGGSAMAVKTWGKHRIVRDPGPMVMTVSRSCFQRTRLPTSRMGAVDLLRRTLESTKVKEGFFVADEPYDLLEGVGLKRTFGMKLALVGASDALEVMDRLEGEKVPLIIGPFDFNTAPRVLKVPAAAHGAGIPIAFTARSPFRNPAYLRLTAALAVREGLDRKAALKALTSGAAAIGGLQGRVGSLAPGMDADIAVFSRHPLDLDARLERLYVSGREVPIHQGDGP